MSPHSLKTALSAFALTAVALACAPAQAAHGLPAGDVGSPLAPGLPDGFSIANLLASSSSTVSSPGNSFTASFSSAVYANTASAADATPGSGFTAGQSVLDFVYQVSNSPNSASSLSRISLFDFAPNLDPNQFSLLVWQTDGDIDGAAPLFASGNQMATSAERGANGKTVSMDYNTTIANKINPGETSFAVVVRANTSNFSQGFFSGINGTTATVSSFAPVAAIPEPETYALMLAGLGVMGALARRRRKS